MVRIGALSMFLIADTSVDGARCGSCDGSAPQPIASPVASAAVTVSKLQGNGNLSMKSSFLVTAELRDPPRCACASGTNCAIPTPFLRVPTRHNVEFE